MEMSRWERRGRWLRQLRKERQARIERVPDAASAGVCGAAKTEVRSQEEDQMAVGDCQQRRRAQAPTARASENAVGGGGQRDGRRGAPPTASKQVLGGEGGGGAADVRGVDRPGLAAGRVGYAEATGRDVNSGRGPPRQRGRPPGLLRPA